MCASSCAALRKNLRTWPESLAGRAISDPASAFGASSAQLLAQQGFAPSLEGARKPLQRIDGLSGP
jgi:hypothetical protein